MKTFLKNLTGLALLTMLAFTSIPTAQAAPEELSVWSGGGTDVSTTLCYTVVSANSKNNGQPVVTYLNATSDKAASVLTFYTAGTPTSCNYTNTTVSIPVNSTNGFAANDVIVIWHKLTDTYERRIVDTFTSATNITVTVASTAATVPGDQIYKATAAGTIPVGNATKELNGTGIYSGQRGKPLLIDLDGTSAVQVNAASAIYVP